jgi:tripartite-type tricarboxylate transporter receptor subunit TctC
MVLAVVCALVLAAPAVQAGADFSGEKITWIIPFKVGGGSDVWSRLYAPFFQKYMPGNPIVAVKNMPGGGSITGGNYFAQRVRGSHGLTVSALPVRPPSHICWATAKCGMIFPSTILFSPHPPGGWPTSTPRWG